MSSNQQPRQNIFASAWSQIRQGNATLLVILSMSGFVLFWIFSSQTLNTVKVNGEMYKNIVRGKDLIADILPPPEYILESYLVVLQLCDETDPAKLQQLFDKSKSLKKDFLDRHAYWDGDLPANEMRTTLLETSYAPAMEFYKIRDEQFLPLIQAGKKAEAKALAAGSMKVVYEAHRQAIDKVVALSTEHNSAYEASANGLIKKRTLMLTLLGFFILVVNVFGFVTMRKVIAQQLKELLAALNALGEGNLTYKLNMVEGSEFGKIGKSLNRGMEKVADTIKTIRHNADLLSGYAQNMLKENLEIGSSIQKISSQAKHVSDNAEQVGRDSQTLAAGTEEMTASIKEISRNTSSASEVVSGMVSKLQLTDTGVTKLRESSEQIGQFITEITAIAEQTNLLALNATIEAARAGESGKGFAVVASEVKELAKATAKASDEIIRRITVIQSDTQGAANNIRDIRLIVGNVHDYQSSIASAVEEQSVTTSEMSGNINASAQNSIEIANTVTALAESMGDTAKGAEKNSEAAKKLTAMATELKTLVGQFQC